jgi:Domain of unknown function (DUF4157)
MADETEGTLQNHADNSNAGLAAASSPRFAHDCSKIPVYPPPAGVMQSKLTINQPGDEYEQEADRVSEQMMRMPEPQLQSACTCGGTCHTCQTQQLAADRVRLSTKRVASDGPGQTTAPPNITDVLHSSSQPLDGATRAYFERRFGHDFSGVGVHTNAEAADSVRSVGARAYTVGRDVVFGAGQYQPDSSAGRRLIAHELTHVVQQSGGAHMVCRAVLYPDPLPTARKENPILRVLRAERSLALTTPTVNGRVVDSLQTLAQGFVPTAIEPKNVPAAPARAPTPGSGSGSGSGAGGSPGSGSGSGSAGSGSGGGSGSAPAVQCGFKDFDVKISANMILPTAPSNGQWGPTYVAGSSLRGNPPAACHGKTRIEVVMKGKPDTDTFYQRILANENEHVADLKSASNQYLVPFYRSILALRGTGADSNACKANLQAQLSQLPIDNLDNFLARVRADIQTHDVPGGHETEEETHLQPDCNHMDIIAKPKPAPPPRGTR